MLEVGKTEGKQEKDLSGSVSTLAVGSSNTAEWDIYGAAYWKRACKILLNRCRYMNLEMVIFKSPF